MGSSYSSVGPLATRCEPAAALKNQLDPKTETATTTNNTTDTASSSTPPPKLGGTETMEQKMWRKFSQQPLVPLGCMATAYFLASGIRSFRKRDPVQSQKMMKARVMAQFATLVCFMGYLGWEKLDFRVMPLYQDVRKVQQQLQQQEAYANNENNNDTAKQQKDDGSGSEKQT